MSSSSPGTGRGLGGSLDSRTTALALAIAVVSLGRAIQVRNGMFDPEALFWLTVGFAGAAVAVAGPRWKVLDGFSRPARKAKRAEGSKEPGEKWLATVLAAGLALQFLQLLQSPPGLYLEVSPSWGYSPFAIGVLLAACFAFLALAEHSSLRRWGFWLLLATHFLLGVWVIQSSPRPFIDVFTMQQQATGFLMNGQNPYAMRYPDIYGPGAVGYGPELSDGHWLKVGFLYPPLSLLMALPGKLLFGDVRYSHLAALTLAGVLIGRVRPGRIPVLAAALMLFTPRVFLVVEQAWTEPFAILLFAAVIYTACRRGGEPPPWVLGLLVAVKQHLFLVLLAWPLFRPERLAWNSGAKALGKAALVGAAVTLPFALWNFGAFWNSVVMFHVRSPFRPDSLSYTAPLARNFGFGPPPWLPLAAALAAAMFALRKASHTPTGYACGAGLIVLAFFAFAKQAFGNYYFLVIAMLCCGLASWQLTPASPAPDTATRSSGPPAPPPVGPRTDPDSAPSSGTSARAYRP